MSKYSDIQELHKVRRMWNKQENENVVIDAISNKFHLHMTVITVINKEPLLVICFVCRGRVEQFQPFLSVFIICPSFSIACPVPVLWSSRWYPTGHQILPLEDYHRRNY